ncbi:MAG: UDP-N-acetylmuramoyl-tripeptide-D-alanyl-D-alanine ligase [Candidatus Woesebacteria bacterium GW2011_GWA1_39_21]|uniref:UDP-N-acetylmuramoyl-tripeptide-D-alanyl-D-alanine ligase n=1 Tax=Candidatus Woesebacteria bacterium GW2011_GWA1_39_21 TaxID=1618550 RepID=A0A0G0QN26_9BACT|nr:MAG: UDP-N-acetylmuramoyl-tripeptide-D-alanyl-D-alanine ligase [Candidatus Woesebacteria bacterium GW2011_GWA1_39_21]
MQFSVLENGKQVNNKFTVKTTGVHFIENISCAILISRILGLSWVEIEKAMSSLITPEGTMSLIKTVTGAIIINDSYNSSQKSFTAALDYLSFFKNKKKVVISSGIIELGEFSQKIHEDLGVKMSELIDKVIVTNKDNALYILNGMADKSKIKYEANLQILKKMFLKSIDDSDVILLEGRQPSAIMDVVKSL